MNIAGLLFLIVAQFLAGRGLLGLFKIRQKPLILFCLSTLCGILVFSLIPMVIQMMHIPITHTSIFVSLCITTLALNIVPARKYDYSVLKPSNMTFKWPPVYEMFFLALFAALMIPSLWRCFYFPPFARDVLSGPEPLAEFAIREQTLNNSVFKMNLLEAVPNLLKPPFVTNLQIIYKMFVHTFGQVWLSLIVVCFLVWIYNLLREKLHPLVACFIMLLFFTIPEVYGYTYIILWDYSNMVYYFAGCYFMFRYIETKEYNLFLFCCLMFGFATYVRLETLIFIALTSPILIYTLWKDNIKVTKIALNVFLLAVIPFIFYFVWTSVFVKHYLPINLDADQGLNIDSKIGYFKWLSDINSGLVFGGINLVLYGYFIYFFLLVLILDAAIFRKFNREARYMLFCAAIIYFGMPLLTYFTHWFNLTTAKRGFFKMFPLIIMYMRSSSIFTRLSEIITNYEFPAVKPPTPAKVQPQPQPIAGQVPNAGKKKKK